MLQARGPVRWSTTVQYSQYGNDHNNFEFASGLPLALLIFRAY